MALNPPEHTTSAAENAPPHEPQLLLRNDVADTTSASRLTLLQARFAELNHRLRRRKQQGRRRLHKLTAALLVVVALALGTVVLCALWLRHAMTANLPQLDGAVHLAGLSAPVQVTRDVQGVPSIHAANLDDLLFAQGYVTAQDRMWQMDALRRHAAGELAEVLGPGMVQHDRYQRYLQLRTAAESAVATMPAEQRNQLAAYARGVNAYLAANGDHLPVEFSLLHYKPKPWTEQDCVLVLLTMWQALSMQFPEKMDREALSAHLPPALLNDLYVVGSWRDRPPTQMPVDLVAPKDTVEQIPLDSTQSSLHLATPDDLLHAQNELEGHRCAECRAGSNNWAISAEHSASGYPLVSNDMHLGLSMPDIWYEAALHVGHGSSALLDVTGFTLPGVPFVVAGRNAHVAWSYTNLGGDVQDVRIENLRGTGAQTEFEQPDRTWAAVEHHAEKIHVRLGHDVTLDVMTTSHQFGARTMATPIISPLYPSEKRALSLAWTVYDPTALQPRFLAVDTAASGTDMVAAFADFGGPSLNLIYADDQKHIGYHAVGRIPVRGSMTPQPRATTLAMFPEPSSQVTAGTLPEGEEEGSEETQTSASTAATASTTGSTQTTTSGYTIGSAIASVPVSAKDAGQQWVGYIPYAELPAIVDPPSGVLATANARITPNDYPYAIANDWVDPYRAERIYHLLEGKTGFTPATMLATEMDVHSEFDLFLAQRFAYAIDHASAKAMGSDAKQLKAAADILRDWNGDVSAEDAAPSILAAVKMPVWLALLVPQIRAHDKLTNDAPAEKLAMLYTWEESNTALENLLSHQPARWLPAGFANWNDFLAAVLARSLKANHAPGDLSRWKYGATHPVEIAHPVMIAYPFLDRLLGVQTGTGRHPSGGDGTTIRAVRLHFGPSERFTADLSDPEATIANITSGQSGNPASAWYLDQFAPWLNGTTFTLPLERPQVTHTLTLEP